MTDEGRSLTSLLNSTTKTVFTTKDFNKIWKYENYNSLIQRLEYLSKTGKITRIRKGLYSINGRKVNELELANKLRTPSYISFETVLYQSGIIFQWDRKITLAGKESIRMRVIGLEIIFRQMKDEILLNNDGIRRKKNYFIASPERAVLDTLYINPDFHFDNLRPINFGKLEKLAENYNRQSIIKLVERLKKNA